MSREITKKEFVELVAEKMGTTKKAAAQAVNAYHEAVGELLSVPDTKIALQGVYTFTSEMTKERTMVNQLSENKEVITVPSKLKAKCKVSPSLVK